MAVYQVADRRHNRNLDSEYWERWARKWAQKHIPDPVERQQFIDADPKQS
jgi:hypothetical protein